MPARYKGCRHSLRIANNPLLIINEVGRHCFFEGDRLGCDDVHKRATLHSGENATVDLLGVFLFAKNNTATRSTK